MLDKEGRGARLEYMKNESMFGAPELDGKHLVGDYEDHGHNFAGELEKAESELENAVTHMNELSGLSFAQKLLHRGEMNDANTEYEAALLRVKNARGIVPTAGTETVH